MKPLRLEQDGETWHLYDIEYQHEGKSFCFDIYARNDPEAASMLRSIRTTAVEANRILGRFTGPAGGLWVRLSCWVRNLFP